MLTLIDFRYYPFAATKIDYPSLFLEKPTLLVLENPELYSKVLSVFEYIMEHGEIPVDTLNDVESILVYYALLDTISALKDARLSSRFALAYSKTASKHLEGEKNEVLVLLANRLGLSARYELSDYPRIPYPVTKNRRTSIKMRFHQISIPLTQYLEVVSKRLMHDPLYSLINQLPWRGRVYLDRNTFTRILEEYIYLKLQSQVDENEPPSDSKFLELVEQAKQIASKYLKESTIQHHNRDTAAHEVEQSELVIYEDAFPPCIKKIIESMKTGGNPSHLERFTLAAFLGQIGMSVDEVLEYFKNTPDFNEKIARYQVEHILGLRGSKKKYMPPNCENLISSGICPASEQCRGGKNPLAVYKYNLRATAKKSKKQKHKGEEAAGGI